MTLLAQDPDLWDSVFSESGRRSLFIWRLARPLGGRVLDVGCATGSLSRALRHAGAEVVGVDINPRFIAKARSKDPEGRYAIGNMRALRLERKFDLLVCVGTTFSYNLTNRHIQECLKRFRAHLRTGGCLVLDVLNAAVFMGPRPFKARTVHRFGRGGEPTIATIDHKLQLREQTMTEQVSWMIGGRSEHRDRAEKLRLLFPQELAFHLEVAGFRDARFTDDYGRVSANFSGRRLIAVAHLGNRKESRRP